MNDISLVISDIDGTLITSNHELTESTISAASALRRAGVQLSLASSRPPLAILPIVEQLGLVAPFAAFNGAVVIEANRHVVAEGTIAPQTTARVKAIADELALDVWLYDTRSWWAARRTAFVEREEHTSGLKAVLEGYSDQSRQRLNKLTVVGLPELVARAEKRVRSEFTNEVSASRSKPRFLDITSHGWHKGAVVGRLAEHFMTPREKIAVIGDGPNDIEMFEQAGLSIAMGQSVDEVRQHARFVTASNDDEGWALAINRYVLGVA